MKQKGASPPRFETIDKALRWRNSQCALHQTAFDSASVVFDYITGEEVAASDAFYLTGEGIEKEAGVKIIAFKSREMAERFMESVNGMEVLLMRFQEIKGRF